MIADRWRQIEAVLDAALDSDPSRWPALLDERCADDPALRADVERLLRHHGRARGFLASPPAAAAAALIEESRGASRVEGARIGAYRVVRQIGLGGTARVYLAERADGEFSQRVALKLLHPGFDTDVDRARFRAERQILASLNHPNIARLLDGGVTDDGQPYLVMELVEGEPIDRYCAARNVSVADRLRMFLAVCDATRYAHRNLVVHRDLKPANILVTREGEVKLLDFGLAKLLDVAPGAASALTTTQRWMTPEYAAPEQVRGQPATTLTDVYQLGVVLYELLTGTLPFGRRGASPDLAHEILQGDPPPPSSATLDARSLRGDLDAITLRALRKDAEERYPSVDALAADVERHLAGLPVVARNASSGYVARRFVRRHRVAVAAATIIAVLLGGYVATLTMYTRRVRATLARVEQEKAKAEASSRFLVGLFSPYGAGFGARDTLTARQLIARGEREVEDLRDSPLAQAELLRVLGTILRSMREYDRADTLFQRAVTLRRAALGDHHPDVAESMFDLGMVALDLGQYRRATWLFSAALDIQRPALGDEHPATVQTTLRLSLAGKPIDARIAADRQALALARRAFGGEHPDVAEAMLRLGMSLRSKGDFDEAESAMRESLALRRRVAPDDDFAIMRHTAQLGILLLHRGKLAESEQLHRQVLAAYEARYGPDHTMVSGALRMLSTVLRERGGLDEAERLSRRDVATRERAFGRDHLEYGIAVADLASVVRAQGRYAEAESLRRAELATFRNTYGQYHPNIAGSLHHLGVVVMEQKRYAEADQLLREAYDLRARHTGVDSPGPAYALADMSRLAREQGDFVAADTLLRRGLRIMKDAGFLDPQFNMQYAHREAVRLYEAWGKPELAAGHRALLIVPPE